jgi:Alpha galactosidase A/NPCBM-associated, NEW3 domain of alpha-galactosidase/Alpha galactosidase C-terminal beta sandwich domain
MRKLITGLLAVATGIPLTAALGVTHAPSARAESNGVGLTPAMGWSSWSFIRHDPTAAKIEAQAKAMKASGLAAVGYQYVNVDDFWYVCPGSQGPDVDKYGRWVPNQAEFPSQGSVNGTEVNGIEAVADYVHKLGLKFGLYVTPGISMQAVTENTAIKGTPYTADEIAEPTDIENNYNCGGMVGIDYSKPGAQAFIDSWADEFASWGVDYVKLDGVGSFDIPDVEAWSNALRQTGRPIHLELSNSLSIDDAATWAQYANGWRTGGDIECYCSPNVYPLTDWSNVESRFAQVAAWQPYGGPGAFNDYDSIEVGNGANDGLTPPQRQTQLSLWALASSPLILGTDLTHLNPLDLSYLKNKAVIAVDQDAIDASQIVNTSTEQVFAKIEKTGDVIVGLFNPTATPAVDSVAASAVGLPAAKGYLLDNLWTGQRSESGGTISATVPPDGVALFRATAAPHAGSAPPDTTVAMSGLADLAAGQPATATASFSNDGIQPVQHLTLRLAAPMGWTVTPTAATHFASVDPGETAQATFAVTAPAPAAPIQPATVSALAAYRWRGYLPLRASVAEPVTSSAPVRAPLQTYSSATDAPAAFGQLGSGFAIKGAGTDVWTDADTYSAIYQPAAAGAAVGRLSGPESTVETEVTGQQDMTGYAKAGIMIRNDIAGSGTTPEGVVLFESPAGGIQLEWDSNGGGNINSVTPPNGTIPQTLPVWLKLVRAGATYTGYYSTDGGSTWTTVGTATVPDQAATQDAGLFMTSHDPGSPGLVDFQGFTVQQAAAGPRIDSRE